MNCIIHYNLEVFFIKLSNKFVDKMILPHKTTETTILALLLITITNSSIK